MADIRLFHKKVSGKPAPADTTKVGGPNWDDLMTGVPSEVRSDLGIANVGASGNAADLTGTLAAAQLPAHTGDATSSAGSAALTLATVNSNVGSFTNTNLTVNAKGLITAASNGSAGGGAVTAGAGHFGFGIDGAAVFDGASAVANFTRSGSVYTAQKPDYFFTTVTFSSGVSVDMTQAAAAASARFYANAGITVTSGTATIKMDGPVAVNQTGGAALGSGHTGAVAGAGASGNQNAGTNASAHGGISFTSFPVGKGGHGGASATNAGSTTDIGAGTLLADSVGVPGMWSQLVVGRLGMSNNGILSGGGGGGSGGGTTGVGSGGGGGAGGGVLNGGSTTVTGTLVVQANGGAGGAAQVVGGSNAGGGSGGGGGILTWGGGGTTQPAGLTLTASGGSGGAPQGTGTAGSAGNAGQAKFYPLGAS